MYNEFSKGKIAWEEIKKIILPEDQGVIAEQYEKIRQMGADEAFKHYSFENNLPKDLCDIILLGFRWIDFTITLEASKN